MFDESPNISLARSTSSKEAEYEGGDGEETDD
jgi:hypothetical protein